MINLSDKSLFEAKYNKVKKLDTSRIRYKWFITLLLVIIHKQTSNLIIEYFG